MDSPGTFGHLLREWRTLRRRSQLDLALEAGISARHLSFLETGRAQPSHEMVVLLASVLEVPLRERNALLRTAGFAATYRETGLSEPAMAEMTRALRLLLKEHEPFAARAMDRRWNLVMVNEGYLHILDILYGERCPLPAFEVLPEPRVNALRVLFESGALRSRVANWEEIARDVLARARRDAAFEGDAATLALLDELVHTSGLDSAGPAPLHEAQGLVIPVTVQAADQQLHFFSTIATVGAAQDITLAELRIEAFHAADAATDAALRRLAGRAR